jgi:hypothetical protein
MVNAKQRTDLMRVSRSFIKWVNSLKAHKRQAFHEICDKLKKLIEEKGYNNPEELKTKLDEIELE